MPPRTSSAELLQVTRTLAQQATFKVTIAEVLDIVEAGELDPACVRALHVNVDRVVKATRVTWEVTIGMNL
jgi:acyl CoA:acetate/3-ketoacid CoA transferase alpha subunit